MKRKTLKIIEGKDKTVILKKPKPILCAIAILSFVLIVVFPFCIDEVLESFRLKEAKALFYVILYLICIVSNLSILAWLFLEKTVLDTQNQEIRLYTPYRHTKKFSEIDDIEIFYIKKGPEVDEVAKVILHLLGGKKITLSVSGKDQAEELAQLLRTEINENKNESCNNE